GAVRLAGGRSPGLSSVWTHDADARARAPDHGGPAVDGRGLGRPGGLCRDVVGAASRWGAPRGRHVRGAPRGESMEMLGVMPPSVSPRPSCPGLDTNA